VAHSATHGGKQRRPARAEARLTRNRWIERIQEGDQRCQQYCVGLGSEQRRAAAPDEVPWGQRVGESQLVAQRLGHELDEGRGLGLASGQLLSAIKLLLLPHLFHLNPPLLELLHPLWLVRPPDPALFRLVKYFRMQVVAALFLSFVFFDLDAVFVGISILAHARHLPTDFYIRRVGADREAVAFDLVCHNRLREGADDGELIAEVTVQGLEVIRQCDYRLAIPISRDVAVLDVHHVRGFDEGVVEVFVFGVERVVYLERAGSFLESARNSHIPAEISRRAISCVGANYGSS
jgi:hypothetical protein